MVAIYRLSSIMSTFDRISSLKKFSNQYFIYSQDEILHFEKQYKKSKGNVLAIAEKKLAILDKALNRNPTSLILLQRKCEIKNEFEDAEKVFWRMINKKKIILLFH